MEDATLWWRGHRRFSTHLRLLSWVGESRDTSAASEVLPVQMSDVIQMQRRSFTSSPTNPFRSMSSKAGPSRTPKKRSANGQDGPASKNPRIDDDEYDATGGAGVDPMEALEGKGDAMEALEGGGDAMEVLEAAMPVLADEFEQEAEREVENAKGLDGKVEEGKMKLVHQVRHQVSIVAPPCRLSSAHTDAEITADIPGRGATKLSVHPDRSTRPERSPSEDIQVRARPFPARRDELYRAQRERAGLRAHLGGKDGRRRVCHRDVSERGQEGRVHLADQGSVEPEI